METRTQILVGMIILLAILYVIALFKYYKEKKVRLSCEDKLSFCTTERTRIKYELKVVEEERKALRKQILILQAGDAEVAPIKNEWKVCSPDVVDGDIKFVSSFNETPLLNGTINVTIKKGKLLKVYMSSRKAGQYVKVPVIIMVKK